MVLTETATYTVEIEYATDCIISDEILVEFFIPETVESPAALLSCDNNLVDGFGIFDLTLQNQVINDQLTGSYEISYFESLENAENNVDPIENPEIYNNIDDYSQTIYARLLEQASNCFSTTSFELTTINPPIITPVDPLEECDNDYDGIDVFDLSPVSYTHLRAHET